MSARSTNSKSIRMALPPVLSLILAFVIPSVLPASSGPSPSATATPPSKGAASPPARAAVPPLARDTCEAAATLVKSWPGTSVDRPEGPVESPRSGKKLPGCRVHARGSFAALKDSPLPDVRLGAWFQGRSWQNDPDYDADGPDGTAFAYDRQGVLCFVHVGWDGGDDSDPDAVPEDWFEVDLGCVAKGAGPPEKK